MFLMQEGFTIWAGPPGPEQNRFPPPQQLDGMYNDNWNPPPPPPYGHPNEPYYNRERRNWDAHHYNYPQDQPSHSRETPYKRRRSHLHDIWGPNFDEEEVQDRFNFNRRAEPPSPYFGNSRFKKPRNYEYKNGKNFNKSRPDLKQVEMRKENSSSVNDSQKPCKQEPEKPCKQEPAKPCKQEEKNEGKPASSDTIVDQQTKTALEDFQKIKNPDEPLKETETKTETQTSPVSVLQEPEQTLDIEEMLSKMENSQENTISLNDIDQNRSFIDYTPLDNLKVVDMDLGSPLLDKVKSDLISGDSSNETVQQARKNLNKPKESKIEIASKEDGAVEMSDKYKERERLKKRRSSVYDKLDIESKDGEAVDKDREREKLKKRRSSVYDRSDDIECKEEAIADKDRERERLKKRRSSVYDRSDDIESKEEAIADKDRERERLKKRRSSVYNRSDDIESKEEADEISDKDRERDRLKKRRSSVYDRSDDRKKSESEHKDRYDRRNSSDSANSKRPRLSPKPLEEEKSPYFPSLNKNYRIPKIAKESDDKTPKFSKAGTPFVSATSIINKITTKESAVYKKESRNYAATLNTKQAVKGTEYSEDRNKQKIINKPIAKVKKKSYSSKEVKDESISKKNYDKYSLERKVKASDQTKSESKGIKNNDRTHTSNRKEKTKTKKLLAEHCAKKQTLKIVIDNRCSIQKGNDIKNSKDKSISLNNMPSTTKVHDQVDIQSSTVNPSTMVQPSTNANKIDDKFDNHNTEFDKTQEAIVIDKSCPNKTNLNDIQSSRVHSNSLLPSKIEVQPSISKIDQFDKEISTRETKSDETRANVEKSCPNKKSVCAQQPSDIQISKVMFNTSNNNVPSIVEIQTNSKKVDDQFDKRETKSAEKHADILNVNKPCPNEKSVCAKTIDDIPSATEVVLTTDNIDDQDLEPFVISPDCNSKESTDSANSKTDNFNFLEYISECFAKPSQSNNCLGSNNCSSSKELKKQNEATSTIKTEKLEIKISTAIKSEFTCDETCQPLIMAPFPRSQRPRVGVVERDCVEEAIVMEQNLDIQTEIQVVKQENKKNDLDLEIIEIHEDVIDLTIDECSESEECIESAKSINMSVKEELLRLFDESSNDKNEKITLYRDDIQCGAEEEVQAVSASLLPSTPKTSDAIKSEVSQNESITENESNVNSDADLIGEDPCMAHSNSSKTGQAEVRLSEETGPAVVRYENYDIRHSGVSDICKSTLPITTGQQFTTGSVLKSTVQRERERTRVSVPVTTGTHALPIVGTVRDSEQTRVSGPNVPVASGTPSLRVVGSIFNSTVIESVPVTTGTHALPIVGTVRDSEQTRISGSNVPVTSGTPSLRVVGSIFKSTVVQSEHTASISDPVSRRISEPNMPVRSGAHLLPIVNAISTVVRDTEQTGSISGPVSRRISEPNVPVTPGTPPLRTVSSNLNSPVIETEQTSRRICEPNVPVTSGTGIRESEQTAGQSVPVSRLSGPSVPVTSAAHHSPTGSAHSSTPRDAPQSTDQPILFNWQEVVAGYIFLIFETIGADIAFCNLMNSKNIPAFVIYQEIKMRNKIRISKFHEYALELMSMFSKINLSFAESHPDVAIPAIFKFFEKYGVGNRTGFFIFLDTIMSLRKEFYLNHYFLRLLYTVVHAYADAIKAKKESTVNPGPVFTNQQLQILNRQIDFCNMVTAILYGKNSSYNPPKRFPVLKQHLQKQNSNLINMSLSNNSFDRQNNQNAQQNSPRPLHASAPNDYQHQMLNNLQYPQNKQQGYSSQHQLSPSSPLIFKIPPDRASQLRSVRKNNFSPTRSDSASNSPRHTFGVSPSGNSARHTSPRAAIPYTSSHAATPFTPSHSNQSVSQNTSPHVATPFTPTHSNQSASQIRRHVYAPMPFASNSIFEPILSPPISKSPVNQLSSNLSSVTQSPTVSSPVNQHITSPVNQHITSPVDPFIMDSPVNQSSNIGSPLINQVDESSASRSLVNEPVSPAVDSVTVKDEPSELNAKRQKDDQEIVTIDLTWLDDMDSEQLKEELDFIKQELDDEHVVLNEEQFPLVADQLYIGRLCICKEKAVFFCGCGIAMYCGKVCQKVDWPKHKPICIKETAKQMVPHS